MFKFFQTRRIMKLFAVFTIFELSLLFSCSAQPKNTTELLKRLRSLFNDRNYVADPIQAYIIPSRDAHFSEYTAPKDSRREFITGFTGSFGIAAVTTHGAALWTDGRYFTQAEQQLDNNWKLMKIGLPSTPSMGTWLTNTLPPNSKIGVDPMLIGYRFNLIQQELTANKQLIVPVETNLIDLIWDNKPEFPNNTIGPLGLKFTGKRSQEKIRDARDVMKKKGASLLLVSALDEIAWVLNLRGSDIPYNPVFFAYLMITEKELHFFVNSNKYTSNVKEYILRENTNLIFHEYNEALDFFKKKVNATQSESKIWVSSDVSYAFFTVVSKKKFIFEPTPIQYMKSVKNKVETYGMINAHIRDAAALCCYFAWLEKEIFESRQVTEIAGAKKLESYRRKQKNYVGLSFETVSAYGSNGAIIHYSPKTETDRVISNNSFYLCDSGAQYKDGTTDVTRTLHFGAPTNYEKECFTRVFKGQTLFGTAVYIRNLKVRDLDILARKSLWDVGLDYRHGTSHGVGSYLNVHEDPVNPTLVEGVFISDEPGYYEDGKFGIRLENIIRVVDKTTKYPQYHPFVTFNPVTLVPIQSKSLMISMLTPDEITYLNAYHKLCRVKVGKLLKRQKEWNALAWLKRETIPITV